MKYYENHFIEIQEGLIFLIQYRILSRGGKVGKK